MRLSELVGGAPGGTPHHGQPGRSMVSSCDYPAVDTRDFRPCFANVAHSRRPGCDVVRPGARQPRPSPESDGRRELLIAEQLAQLVTDPHRQGRPGEHRLGHPHRRHRNLGQPARIHRHHILQMLAGPRQQPRETVTSLHQQRSTSTSSEFVNRIVTRAIFGSAQWSTGARAARRSSSVGRV